MIKPFQIYEKSQNLLSTLANDCESEIFNTVQIILNQFKLKKQKKINVQGTNQHMLKTYNLNFLFFSFLC